MFGVWNVSRRHLDTLFDFWYSVEGWSWWFHLNCKPADEGCKYLQLNEVDVALLLMLGIMVLNSFKRIGVELGSAQYTGQQHNNTMTNCNFTGEVFHSILSRVNQKILIFGMNRCHNKVIAYKTIFIWNKFVETRSWYPEEVYQKFVSNSISFWGSWIPKLVWLNILKHSKVLFFFFFFLFGYYI